MGRVNRSARRTNHRDRNIRLFQSDGVINTITDEADLTPLGLKACDQLGFARRQSFGIESIGTDGNSGLLRGNRLITGNKQDGADLRALTEIVNDGAGFGAEWCFQDQDTDYQPVTGYPDT